MADRVDIRRAADLARQLGDFTRPEFQRELGVSGLEAHKLLRRLREEKDCIRVEGARFVFDDPDTRKPPVALYADTDLRIVARKLGRFTVRELMDATGLGEGQAHGKVKWLVEMGVVRDSGKRGWREGRKPVIYEAVALPKEKVNRDKRKPVEVEMRERGELERIARTNGHHVARYKHPDPDFDKIVAAVYEAGGFVEKRGKHAKCVLPTGIKFGLSGTPGDNKAFKKARAEARRHGLNV